MTPKHHGAQHYFILYNKAGMPDLKCKLHISGNLFGKCSNQTSFKDGLGGALGNMNDAVRHYQKNENKWKRWLKTPMKQNKMIFCMAKSSGSRCELKKIKKIKKIRSKVSKKRSYSIRDISSSDSDSYFSLFSYSERDKIIHPTELKEINKLDHLVTNNIKNKDQCNDAIGYEPKFDSKFSLSIGTKYPLIGVYPKSFSSGFF